ncbi:MAG TPA: 50S ribosomal protein L6 [Spirochaetota bacterium]|nr:50S ribosomal protein L6 [Spirochaetota bacterium]HOM37929.1 50S ribosomal protein L6 [Spirochaetota bacterium]HPQ48733.1 50S ribosomal protein L6 [Spirochaetota bacterium]
MSKIGRKPISIPKGVEVVISDNKVKVKGPKGELIEEIKNKDISIKTENNNIYLFNSSPDNSDSKMYYGLYRSLVNNMVKGVSNGFTKRLLLVGTGYRAKVTGQQLELSIGFSHPVLIDIPKGIECKVEEQTKIIISGIDKQKVGQFAANVRGIRPPEPYQGKGIRYEDEKLKKKAGKSGKK